MNRFLQDSGAKVPVICGAMYPCSNPELVAAASKAGAMAIVQPLSLVFVYRKDFREGLRFIKAQNGGAPFGLNLLVEKSSSIYEERNRRWLNIALEEGVRFFVTALGNPSWVTQRAHELGAKVYHDVTDRRWAEQAMKSSVDGFICVNNRAGGHAGTKSPEELITQLKDLGKPLICAGGVGDEKTFREMLGLGYEGVQMGTRFIATQECAAHADYKNAILKAKAKDIVLTDKISGVPVSVIKTPYIEKIGTKSSPLARWLLQGRKTKHWMRLYYTLQSLWQLKKANLKGAHYKDYWQAGKSVESISQLETAASIVERFKKTYEST